MLGNYRKPAQPVPVVLLLAVAAIYLLSGNIGHDPWKNEDAIHIGIAYGFATQGGWMFPHVAGDPWLQSAPLFHWVAAITGRLFEGWLSFHNAARLATPLFGALFLLALAQTARTLHGQEAGQTAPLLAIGTLGLLQPLHEAQPAVAGLACAALAYWGAARSLRNLPHGTWLLGLGLGFAYPADGLTGLLTAIPALVVLILRHNWKTAILALAIALPIGLTWPVLAYGQSPLLWANWWKSDLSEVVLTRNLPDIGHLEQLSWSAWPVLPIALWTLWLFRRNSTDLTLPLTGCLIGLIWYLTGLNRTLNVLPVLFPCMLLAAAGVVRLRRGAANALDWFGLMTFTFAASLIWLGASAQALHWPPRIAHNFDKLVPGHTVHYPLPGLLFALAITLLWLLSWRQPRSSWRPSFHCGAGMTLIWALVSVFWLSWLDHAKSYRQPVMSLKTVLPAQFDCIERVGINSAQRASLDYFAGIRTVPAQQGGTPHCHWRLSIADKNRKPSQGWIEHWRGQRPSDRDERWFLDHRSR